MGNTEELDLVVIGAGSYGLAAAKTFLEVNPSASIAILDSEETIGGVWAERKLYPGLKTNNMLGTYEFSDLPMDTATYGIKAGEHISGEVVHRYLKDYARKFGIYSKIRFQTKVLSAEQAGGEGWLLTVTKGFSDKDALKTSEVLAKKLIVATGVTSDPFLPRFSGSESFGAPLFHTGDFKEHAGTLESAKTVAVFGGTKSAWDAVYAYATRGVKVEWIIRESGHGPTWMAPPYVTPLKRWLEKLVHTRFITWLSPCIWGNFDGYSRVRSFLHGTAIGRTLVNTFWGILGNDVKTLNKYSSHPELAKLEPWNDAFFVGASGISILNYDTDFFELVRNGTVSVHIADIEGLAPKTVLLTKGERLKVDAMVCATGWKHRVALDFLPKDLDLGLPHHTTSAPNAHTKQANEEILSRFPRLKQRPAARPKYVPLTESKGISDEDLAPPEETFEPFQHYRFMVPPSTIRDRNIAFTGFQLTISTTIMAQAQALWIAAYFSDKADAVAIPADDEEVRYEAVLHNRFGRWRYPEGFGVIPDFAFDAVPYLDMLLTDLGLDCHRKRGLLRDMFSPYGPEDYKGLVGEWVSRVKR
ncbi:hypothetical protein V499_02260 [Pseudogymnoascus sp. VKM F-103]|nr:hypothetical protein V499_02260 [Pseudogymnoascus sp. VKM F-103]